MRWVDDRIAIGDASDAMRAAELEAAGITGVLSLDWFPVSPPGPSLVWRKHGLIDGPGNAAETLQAALADLEELLVECPRVLVHCREGVSRSPFVVACHLARTRGCDLDEAIDGVREGIGWLSINPNLLDLWATLEADAEPA